MAGPDDWLPLSGIQHFCFCRRQWALIHIEKLWADNYQTADGVLMHGITPTLGWLLLAGPLTALPLLCFAAGARRLPLATLGLVQYVSPTLQLLVGVVVFHETFDSARLVGFACIWAGLALVSADALGLRLPRALRIKLG